MNGSTFKKVFQSRHIAVEEHSIGNDVQQIRAIRTPAVRLLIPTTSGLRCNNEFRPSTGNRVICLPGGKIFSDYDEFEKIKNNDDLLLQKAFDAAIIEAGEEQGIIVNHKDITFFSKMDCGITMQWDIYFFIINNFFQGTQKLEDDEDIKITTLSWNALCNAALEQKIEDPRCCLAVLQFLNSRDLLRL